MSRKIGLWLIGARGGVSTTVAIGLSALKRQLTDQCGLVSCLPEFNALNFTAWDDVALGGHEIRKSDVVSEAEKLSRGATPVFDPRLLDACREDLNEFDTQIRPGLLLNVGSAIEALASPEQVVTADSGRAAIEHVQADLKSFRDKQECESVIVINLASTEPAVHQEFPTDWHDLEPLLDQQPCPLPASSLYAIAALQLGMPFVNFTPSLANGLTAIDDLARKVGTCHMGHDGKTGETFLKSVLAPAFAHRNLHIMSWVGHNIFGNMDGQILDDPENKKTKVTSKNRMLGHMLGYDPQSHISIEYIESLGDWKTAWDHIHFRGFMGTPMTMQFTWQGCDSILAAPLVLDLLRFTELSHRQGETGLLIHLASFFKSPLGTMEHDFAKQFQLLLAWTELQQPSDFDTQSNS